MMSGNFTAGQCKYLQGAQIKPATAAEARKLIGRRVTYLLERDIDRSGRGYIFPKDGIITDVHGKSLTIENGNWVGFSSIVDMTPAASGTEEKDE